MERIYFTCILGVAQYHNHTILQGRKHPDIQRHRRKWIDAHRHAEKQKDVQTNIPATANTGQRTIMRRRDRDVVGDGHIHRHVDTNTDKAVAQMVPQTHSCVCLFDTQT